MIIKITEKNMWERESWSYILDLKKQKSSALNDLMIFIRCANMNYEEVKKEAQIMAHPTMFAASYYSFHFYDSIELKEDSVVLIHDTQRLHVSLQMNGYKSSALLMDMAISTRKMKSAMIKMRNKKENCLYKSFEDIFLCSKVKEANVG